MIRAATDDDVDAIIDVWLAASRESHAFIPYDYWLSQVDAMRDVYLPGSETLVATDSGGRVIGFASLAGDVLAALFVRSSHQGSGIGASLLRRAQSMRRTLTLAVYLRNVRAGDFYRRSGFRLLEERVDEPTGEREACMRWDASA